MASRRPARLLRWVWVVVPVAAGVVAYRHRDSLVTAVGLVAQAQVLWLGPAALAIGGVYFFRASAYGVPLRLLGYSVRHSFLWRTALVATSLHQLVPAGGASGYAFLTWALRRRGVTTGQASLIALIDTLSYATAMATLVVAALVYLILGGTLLLGSVVAMFVPGVVTLALAAVAYWLQRDRRRFVGLLLRVKRRLADLAGRRWPDAPIRQFLREYYAGKRVISEHPAGWARMVGFQYLTVICDAVALSLAFVALGLRPPVWVVFLGLVVAMAGVAVITAPGGGGSFEVLMSAFFAAHGLRTADAIAAVILYRVVAFWLPIVVAAIALWGLRRRQRDVMPGRRQRSSS